MATGIKKYLEIIGGILLVIPPTLAILLTAFVILWELIS